MISAYAQAISSKLASDPELSERVREEIEDHLYEAAKKQGGASQREAEMLAIRRFGDIDFVASQFAGEMLARRTRAIRALAVFVVVISFLRMRLRDFWIEGGTFPGVALGDISQFVMRGAQLLDRYAFILAICMTVISFLPERALQRAMSASGVACGTQFVSFAIIAFGGLATAVSVAGGLLMMASQAVAFSTPASLLVPVGAAVLETSLVVHLLIKIYDVSRDMFAVRGAYR